MVVGVDSGTGTNLFLLSSNIKISLSSASPSPSYGPFKEPLNNPPKNRDAIISSCTFRLPLIDADTFTTNPKSGEISAVAEPLCSRFVSNARFAILIFRKPLPSPKNDDPDASTISLPLTNNPPVIDVFTFTCNPLLGDISAVAEPETILSNSKSSRASAGILNNPLPSPSYLDAVIGTLTNNLLGSITANAEPEFILSNSRFSNASNGILNNPPPSPWKRDAVIEPLTDTEPVNSEPICEPVAEVITLKSSPFSTDAVTEPDAILGAA